ncbi:MAG TPA: hypothetical protein VMT66_16445 [Steroidobacteraceae bacterium]|nr:hypothetical protein [Steroidobacteraceae bacterium]
MSLAGNMSYAAARVHARYGSRLDDSAWRRIEASRSLGQYLEAVRRTALAPWVANIDIARDPHAIEGALRSEWRTTVRALASWHAQVWQPWVRWWAWLPLLPLIARLARPAAVPPWMLSDPVCGPIAVGTPEERATALEATALAPLAAAVRNASSVGLLWQQEAQRRLAPADDPTLEQLRHLLQLLSPGIYATPPQCAPALARLFRVAGETIVASGCYLALLLLDMERLRGGLVFRRLFHREAA